MSERIAENISRKPGRKKRRDIQLMESLWSDRGARTANNRASQHHAFQTLGRLAPAALAYFADDVQTLAAGDGKIKFTLLAALGRLGDVDMVEAATLIAERRLTTADGLALCRVIRGTRPGYLDVVRRLGRVADTLAIESDPATVVRALRDVAELLEDDAS